MQNYRSAKIGICFEDFDSEEKKLEIPIVLISCICNMQHSYRFILSSAVF